MFGGLAVFAAMLELGTWNIRGSGMDHWAAPGQPTNWVDRMGVVCACIDRHGFELLGLQECSLEQSAYIRAHLKGWTLVGVAPEEIDEGAGKWPNPIIYRTDRFKLLDWGRFVLSETPHLSLSRSWDSRFPRSCTWAVLRDLRGGSLIAHFNVHLDNAGEVAREKAMELVIGRIREMAPPSAAVFLTGDMNTAPETKPIGIAKSALRRAYEISETAPKGPYRSDNMWIRVEPEEERTCRTAGERIDHIFVSEGVRVLDHETFVDPYAGRFYASDHFPLKATVEIPEPLEFENRQVRIQFNRRGELASIFELATGRELVGTRIPFVEVRDAENKPIRPVSLVRHGDRLEFAFGKGTCVIRLIPFTDGWTVCCESCDVPDAEKLVLAQILPSCNELKGELSNAVISRESGVVVRGYGPQVEMSDLDCQEDYRGAVKSRKTCAWVAREHGFAGQRAGFAAGLYERLVGMLREMAVAGDVVRTPCGGPWSLSGEANRASYLFGTWMDLPSVDDWIRLMDKSGCRIFHLHAWWKTRGHYEPDPTCFPNGMDDLLAACRRFKSRGKRVGTHTLSAVVQFGDPFVDPRWFDDYQTDAAYTLARPYRRGDTELFVNECPWEGHAKVLTGATRGNILRLGDDLVQYSDFTTEPPYRFTGVRVATAPWGEEEVFDDTQAVGRSGMADAGAAHGATRILTRAEYPAGAPVTYLHHAYAEFAPKPGSKLAEETTDRIADVFNRCGLDEIYFDGSEACNSVYSIDWLRNRTFQKLRQPPEGIVNSASVRKAQHWWYRSFVGGWDHPNFCPKGFHDRHIAVYTEAARADFMRTDLGWWNVHAADRNSRGYFPDEAEYFGCKCAANDATVSVMGALPTDGPLAFAGDMQLTITGWWENLRYARAFKPGLQERMRTPGEEFRLRQDASGAWCVTPYAARRHRVATEDFARWRETFAAARPAEIRVESLYAPDRKSGKSVRMLDASMLGETVTETAAGVSARAERGFDGKKGETIRLTVSNDTADACASWARIVRRIPLACGLKAEDVSSLWVKGDGSGAVVNFQLGTAPAYGRAFSENFVVLDFTGWRKVDLLLRERDADITSLFAWPYVNPHDRCTPGAIFRTPVKGRPLGTVSVYVNGIPKGGAACVEFGAWDSVPQHRGLLAANAVVSLNGKDFALPFALPSGEYAELADGAWTHYAESGEPLERVAANARPQVKVGANELAFIPHPSSLVPHPSFPRVEVTVFPIGERETATDALTTAQKRELAVEYELPRIFNPAKGLVADCDVKVRQGETARLGFEILGPARNPVVAGQAIPVTLETVLDKVVCEDGRTWTAVRVIPGKAGPENRTQISRREPLGEGVLENPIKVTGGTTHVTYSSEIPGSRVTFVKYY